MVKRGLCLAALLFAGCQTVTSPPPSDAALVRARLAEPDGMRVFALRCASCHGETGNAPGAPPVMGPGTLARFERVADLQAFVAQRMPPDDPVSEDDARVVSRYLAAVAGRH